MDVILCLGGNTSRLYAAIDLFKKHPNSKIVVSSEGNPDLVVSLLDRAGVPRNQFILDFQAWDTVTNFTKTKKLVLSYKPRALCIVTDKFHMRRSMAIAQAVYWLNDIQLVPSHTWEANRIHQKISGLYVQIDYVRGSGA